MHSGNARYAREGGTWFLKLSGDLRHTLGPALNALLDRAFTTEGTSRFLVDLSAAEGIDSTCLGILARIANWTKERDKPRPIIVTSNEDIVETLYAVCFDRLFDLRGETPTNSGAWTDLPSARTGPGTDAEQMVSLVLEAHRRLCVIDERNRAVFSDVIEALEREQGHRGTESEPG